MKFNPKHNHVIIEPVEITDQKQGFITIPDTNNEVPRTGIVLAIGVGTFTLSGALIPMQCSVGEKVYYPSFGGQKISINGKEYVVMKDPDVLSGIEDDSNEVQD
jgi:chaperonin GroES